MKQKIEKWYRWVGSVKENDSIAFEMTNLAHNKRIYYEVKEIIKDNRELENKQSLFFSFLARTYSDSTLMAIRRQVRHQKDSKSLIKLVKEIRNNANFITIKFYQKLYNDPELGRKDFLRLYANETGQHLNPRIVDRELEKLKKVISLTEEYTDQRLAHLDTSKPSYIPSYKDLDESCNLLFDVYKFVYNILYASEIKSLEPKIKPGWKSIFQTAWINHESST